MTGAAPVRSRRLFLAIDLDDPAREAIRRLAASLRAAADDADVVRWVPAANLHLTLAFLGNSDAAAVETLRAAASVPWPQAPFDLSISRAGVFPPRGAPRALWVAPPWEPPGSVARLHRMVWGRLAALGREVVPGPFMPHITLGRVRRGRRADGVRAAVERLAVSERRWRVDHVTLYESRTLPTGSTYHPLARAPLVPRGRHGSGILVAST